MLVSDRAKSLIKLGSPEYLDVCSMPDLFHFNQDLAKIVGAPLGKAWNKAKKEWKQAEGIYSERKEYEDKYLLLDTARRYYQNGIHGIHKTVLPFNEDGSFREISSIRKKISESVTIIEKQAKHIGKEVQEKAVSKIFAQIPGISQGVADWQEWTVERTNNFALQIGIEIRQEELQKWLLHYLLPVFIWELTLRRVPSKKKNERLIKYYKEVRQKARDKLKGSRLENYMTESQYKECENGQRERPELFSDLLRKSKVEMVI